MWKSRQHIKLNFLVLLAAFLGCSFEYPSVSSLNSHRSGRTIGKELKFTYDCILGYTIPNLPNISDDGNPKNICMFDFRNQIPLWEHIDLIINLNADLSMSTGFKYQIKGDKESSFASSLYFDFGLALAYTEYFSYSSVLEWCNSFHPRPKFSLYFNPKLVLTNFKTGFLSLNRATDETAESDAIFGCSLGVIYGQYGGGSLEFTLLGNPVLKSHVFFFSIGYSLPFAW